MLLSFTEFLYVVGLAQIFFILFVVDMFIHVLYTIITLICLDLLRYFLLLKQSCLYRINHICVIVNCSFSVLLNSVCAYAFKDFFFFFALILISKMVSFFWCGFPHIIEPLLCVVLISLNKIRSFLSFSVLQNSIISIDYYLTFIGLLEIT